MATQATTDQERACRECGCTELAACVDEHDVACHWVEWDLCSVCAPVEALRIVQWYCGDPTCWICLREGRVPKGETVVERHV